MNLRLSVLIAAALTALRFADAQSLPNSWSVGTPVKIPSGDVQIEGWFFRAPGAGMHPVVIYLHGLPGFSGDLDLPGPLSRAGWNVLTLHYRGSWGSPGDYSYAHQIEDAIAAIDFVRNAANARTYSTDPRRIVLVGHSTGGLIALITAAGSSRLAGLVVISASDDAAEAHVAPNRTATPCPPPLSGCTNEGLDREVFSHASAWTFAALAPHLTKLPILMVTCNDPYASEDDALEKALIADGAAPPARVRLSTDHAYTDQRPALATAVAGWLRKLAVTP